MSKLHFTMVQTSLVWENAQANRDNLSQMLANIEPTDVIVLPEMFTTGFSMNPRALAEKEDGESVKWMIDLAKANNCVVTGSLIIEKEERYYNRLFWVYPTGEYVTYNKRHLFSLAGEEKYYARGKIRLVVEYRGFKIMPLICYDLRFPVWSRNNLDYDIALYVANWPERRSFFWKQLLVARAIENQAYVIGLNRVGEDGNGVEHSGDSVCLDPLGNSVNEIPPFKEGVFTTEIKRDTLTEVREKFQFLNDQDQFSIAIRK